MAETVKSILILDDDHVTYRDGRLVSGGDFHLFIPYLTDHVEAIRVCTPTGDEASLRRELNLAKVTIVGTYPYRSYLRYLRLLPSILWKNLPIYVREVRKADFVLLRMPSANALLVSLIARIFSKPTGLIVVGDTRSVSRLNPKYRNPPMKLARLVGSALDWCITSNIARRSIVFAYGRHLEAEFRRVGVSRVMLTFTSLITEEDISNRQDTCNGATVRLLFVGRLSPEKVVGAILDAAACLASSGRSVHVDIVGDGPTRTSLDKKISELEGVEGLSTTLHGYVQAGPSLNSLFEAADVFVLPSLSEGVPKVLIKAMASGLPIVATNVGGIGDIVSDRHTGLLVSPGSQGELNHALQEVIETPELRHRLIQNGYAFAMDHTAPRQAEMIMRAIRGNVGLTMEHHGLAC